MSADYEKKRDLLCSALNEAGLTPSVPDGAYYVLAEGHDSPRGDGAGEGASAAPEDGRGGGGGICVLFEGARRESAALLLREAG